MTNPKTRAFVLGPITDDINEHTSLGAEAAAEFEATRRLRDEMLEDAALQASWRAAFDNDTGLLGRIVKDILKLDQSVAGRPGPRPEPEYNQNSMNLLRQLMAEDYCSMPFARAFDILAGTRPTTQLANLVDISRSQVRRLRHGEVHPTLGEISRIAGAFKKHPSFFREYRTAYIQAGMGYRYIDYHDASVAAYRAMSRPQARQASGISP